MKCAVGVWLLQRVTAFLLLLLIFLFCVLGVFSWKFFSTDTEYLASHKGLLLFIALFSLIAQCHALPGLKSIIEDYITSSSAQRLFFLLSIAFIGSTFLAFAAIFYKLLAHL